MRKALLMVLLTAVSLSQAATIRVMHEDHVWHAKPTASQVPGSTTYHVGDHDPFALWFNSQLAWATFQTAVDVENVRLHCALAGQDGPLLWTTGTSPVDVEQYRHLHRIGGVDLTVQSPSGPCPVDISDVASLKQAANLRLLYVEYERNGELVRGQFWPKRLATSDYRLRTYLSTEQVPGSAVNPPAKRLDPATLRLQDHTRNLDFLDITWSRKSLEGFNYQDALIRCGPPGADGELIARGSEFGRYLRNVHIHPTDGTGSCGMVISTVASIVEALLRGWLFIELIPAGTDEPLRRSQFPSPLD